MSGAVVTVKVSQASAVRLVASRGIDFSNPVKTALIALDEFQLARGEFTGLDPDARYFVSVENASGVRDPSYVGSFRTPPSGPHSFGFASASCSDTGSNGLIFDRIRERVEADEISFFMHTGDIHYRGIDTNEELRFHAAFDEVFLQPRQNALWRICPMPYMWDDHDYGPNDSDRDSPSRQAAIAAYRRRVPSYPLVRSGAEDAPYYSFVRGRVRFIVTDVRSERAQKGEFNSADPQQVAFTATQRDWLFAEMLAAQAADQAIIWVNTKPWVADITNGADHWGGYDAARQEIASFINTNSLNRRVAILSGDMHAVAYDDGTSVNNPAGLRVMQAAPLEQTRSAKGGPYTTGPFPTSGTTISGYGVIDVTDETGSGDLGVRFRGVLVDRDTGAETTVIDQSFDLGANL